MNLYTSVEAKLRSSHIAILCAWCKKLIREGSGPASHSICSDCSKRYFPEES